MTFPYKEKGEREKHKFSPRTMHGGNKFSNKSASRMNFPGSMLRCEPSKKDGKKDAKASHRRD